MKPVKFKTTLCKMGEWTMAVATIDTRKIFGKGHIRVKGSINGAPIKGVSLMPRKEGNHCIAVKKSIRKVIRKEAGDLVEIILEIDTDELEIPLELQAAFEASPEAKEMFDSFSFANRKYFVEHITEAKNQSTKERRAVAGVLLLEKRYHEKHGNQS